MFNSHRPWVLQPIVSPTEGLFGTCCQPSCGSRKQRRALVQLSVRSKSSAKRCLVSGMDGPLDDSGLSEKRLKEVLRSR